MKLVYIDFEYNGTAEAKLNVVSVSWSIDEKSHNVWCESDGKKKKKLKEIFKKYRDDGHIFVAWNVGAEGAAMIALGLNPTKMQWIDLQAEYKMLCNHWDKYRYGYQLIKGKVVKTYNPSIKRELTSFKAKKLRFDTPPSNLAAGLYKMLGVKIDTAHKDAMRDLIIAGGPFSDDDKADILKYGKSDVEHLPELWREIKLAYKKSRVTVSKKEILYRGHIVAHTELMTRRGYPVSKLVRNFSTAIPEMTKDLCEDINSQFPEMKIFEWNKKELRFTFKQKPLKDWIEKEGLAKKWEKTEKGGLSLGIDAWSDNFSYRSPYPRDILPAQIIRYLRFKQSLNGFRPKGANAKDKSSFYDVYGKDLRARAYLNPYGSQSGRFQPSAKGFIPLKSNWMRWFIQPPKGYALASIDYSNQEYLIAALLSGDEVMYESYLSGDPYFDFAKKAKAVPADAKKQDHIETRTAFKSTTLGILYQMGAASLADKLTKDVGRLYSEKEAQKLIDLFERTYKVFTKWRKDQFRLYQKRGYLKLADGWVMFGDNKNRRSVGNCPIQGMGSCILRQAIKQCHERGLSPVMPLHDALYIQYKIGDYEALNTFAEVMEDAFVHYFEDQKRAYAIRLDGHTWSKELEETELYEGKELSIPWEQTKYYLEDRGKEEFSRFSKYFLLEK